MFRKSTCPHRQVFYFTAILLLSGALNLLMAGLSIEGSVTDTSGVPLIGAHVSIKSRSEVVVTNWEGRYTLSDLPAGRYALTATHIGYNQSTPQDVAVHEGIPLRVNIRLSPVVLSLSPVSVTFHSSTKSGSQSLIVTREQWAASSAISIEDVLRDLPGVTLLEGDRTARLSLRGSPPRTVKVDLDGIPLNDAGTGEAELSSIDLQQLESIEIEFHGIGGAVKLITRESNRADLGWEGAVGYGSTSKEDATVQLEGERKGVRWFGSAGVHADEGNFSYELDDGSTHRRVNNRLKSLNGIGKIGMERAALSVSGGIYIDSYRRGIPGLTYSAPTPEADMKSERVSGRVSVTSQLRSGEIGVVGYLSDSRSRYRSPALQYNSELDNWVRHIPVDNRQTSSRHGVTVDHVSASEIGRLNFRYRYRLDRFEGEDLLKQQMSVAEVGYGAATRRVHSLDFIGERSWALNRFTLTLNPTVSTEWIKDSNRDLYQITSPAISMSVTRALNNFTANLTAGYGKSVSLPSFNTQFLVESMFAVGNQDIEPEEGETVNVGLSVASAPLHIGVNWYQRQVSNLIVWRRNFIGKYYPDNLLSARITGVDCNASFEVLSRTSLRATYSYQNPLNDTPGDINRGKLIPLNPQHSGSMEAVQRMENYRFVLRANWVGERYSSESNVDPLSTAGMGLPAYETCDISLSKEWKINRVTLTALISVNNLLDRSYRVIERSPMPGRTYYSQLTFTL